MMQFENYQWEDHVPRKGSWKFNLAIGALALGLIAAAFPHKHGNAPASMSAVSKPAAADPSFFALQDQRQFTPAAFTGSDQGGSPCPYRYADS
jgi:hypothetical protein